jgi:2-methylisocitrate lyase-like PEP mutase family enzyme
MDHYKNFCALHSQPRPLVIANAWNVKSAQIVEQNGFDAIGTSSGAIAESLGYPDGENIPFTELLYMVKRIRASTSLPLSVDFERGYTNDLNALSDNIQMLIDAGVVGINLEDAQGEEIYLKKLSSIRNYLEKHNQQLFINARTDAFLLKLPSPLETTLNRAKLYQQAGADGLFVTAMPDGDTLKQITSATTLPVNVVCTPKLPTVEYLTECGVRRISMAVFPYRATYKYFDTLVKRVRAEEGFAALF